VYGSVFNSGFGKLPEFVQTLQLISLVLMLGGLCVLLLPASYDRFALFPFAIGLGVEVFTAAAAAGFRGAGTVFAMATTFVAIAVWYLFAIVRRIYCRRGL